MDLILIPDLGYRGYFYFTLRLTPKIPVLNPGVLMNDHASYYANSNQPSLKERRPYN